MHRRTGASHGRSDEGFCECDPPEDIGVPGVRFGAAPGQVTLVSLARDTYGVKAISKAHAAGGQHWFSIERDADGSVVRDCGPHGEGACRGDDALKPDGSRW
jgi:hypothetical protein